MKSTEVRTRLIASILGAGALAVVMLSVAPVSAHHSFSSLYNYDVNVTLEGTVVRFMNRNPHGYLHLEAPDKSGQMQLWSLETASAGQFARTGVKSTTIQAGDKVIITGHPAHNLREFRAVLMSIERPSDGFKWGRSPNEVLE